MTAIPEGGVGGPNPADEFVYVPGPVSFMPAFFLEAPQGHSNAMVLIDTEHNAGPPQPLDDPEYGLLVAPTSQLAANTYAATDLTARPWQPQFVPLPSYQNLRAPRPNEAIAGPDYNPSTPLGLLEG